MWKCALCRREFSEDTMAIELRFGYVDRDEIIGEESCEGFYPEEAIAPICDDCAVSYIRGAEARA